MRSTRSGLVCAAALLVGACSKAPARGSEHGGSGTGPVPPDSGVGATQPGSAAPAPSPTATVTLAAPSGAQSVTVEVVKSPALLEKGLMYRRYMPPDRGMLFLMGEESEHHFWMRNTLIPLDIVFIKRDMTVAGVAANAKPLDETPVGVPTPSLYVLEVNGGWMAAHGIGAGAKVTFANVEAAAH